MMAKIMEEPNFSLLFKGQSNLKRDLGQSRPLFVYICSFLITISIQIEKSIDGVLGIRTRGHRMVGADETTELWQPPQRLFLSNAETKQRVKH